MTATAPRPAGRASATDAAPGPAPVSTGGVSGPGPTGGDRKLTVVVRLAAALRSHAGGCARVELAVDPPVTVRAVLDALAATHPAVGRRLRDEAGELRRHVNVFVGPDRCTDVAGLATPVPAGVEVTVLPAISGG